MGTANEDYFDAATRHHVGVLSYAKGLNQEVQGMLEDADAQFAALLLSLLTDLPDTEIDFTGDEWQGLIDEAMAARETTLREIEQYVTTQMEELAQLEGEGEVGRMQDALPGQQDVNPADAATLTALVTSGPIAGYLLSEWFDRLIAADHNRLVGALQGGVVSGVTPSDIVRRVTGTRGQKYADGLLAITRRQTQTTVRTIVNYVSEASREAVWKANPLLVGYLLWISILDAHTTLGCLERNLKGVPFGRPLPSGIEPLEPPGIRPPAHEGCRSNIVLCFSPQAGTTAEIGGPPEDVKYPDWLRRQSVEFQDEVLGKTKGKLFRDGGLKIDQFIVRNGAELTLDQLAKTYPKAFQRAGVD